MTCITEDDFFGLVGDLQCFDPLGAGKKEEFYDHYLQEEANDNIEFSDTKNVFIFTEVKPFTKDESYIEKIPKIEIINPLFGNKKKRSRLNRVAGELLVNYLRSTEQYEEIEHSSLYENGLGYDIIVKDKKGHITYIAVKATRLHFQDRFNLDSKEMNKCNQIKNNDSYKVYRIYDFDDTKGTACFVVYDYPFNNEKYNLSVNSWKVCLK